MNDTQNDDLDRFTHIILLATADQWLHGDVCRKCSKNASLEIKVAPQRLSSGQAVEFVD